MTAVREPVGHSAMPVRLLLTGKLGAGKTTARAYLVSKHGAVAWSRAELMKRLAHALYDGVGSVDQLLELVFPDSGTRAAAHRRLFDFVSLQYEEEAGKPRRLYQDVTQLCQELDPLCFERELAGRITDTPEAAFSLIEDVRSRPAFEFFGASGYTSCRIETGEEARKRRMQARDGHLPGESTFSHVSETDLDDARHDFIVSNDEDSPHSLYRQLDEVVYRLQQRA